MCLLLFHTDCLPASPLLSWVPPGRLSNLSQMPFRYRYSLIKTFHISKASHCFKVQSSPLTLKFKCSLTWSLSSFPHASPPPAPPALESPSHSPRFILPVFPLHTRLLTPSLCTGYSCLPGTHSLHVLLAPSGSDLKIQVEGHQLCGSFSLHG